MRTFVGNHPGVTSPPEGQLGTTITLKLLLSKGTETAGEAAAGRGEGQAGLFGILLSSW